MSRLLSLLFALFFLNAGAQVAEKDVNYAQPADSVIVLNEISVVAYRGSGRLLKVPGSLSVLTNEGLMISDGTGLAATLNTLPGINMQTGTFLTSRIVIRGMGSRTPYNTNRIRTYLNDIPLTTADGVSTPEEIDLLSLDKVEVIKGPSSALYGSGLGGSINMYSRQKADNEGTLDAQYGSFNTFKGHLSGTIKTGNASLWGSISHLNSDGYRENNHYKRTSFITTTRWEQTKWSVNSTLLLIGVDGGIPSSLGKTLFENNPRAAAPNWKAIGGFKKYRKAIAAVTLTNNLSDRITNNFTLFGKWNDNYEKRPFNNLDDQSLSGGIRNKLSYHTRKSDLTAGFEWIAEQYRWKLDNNNVLLNENSETRFLMNIFAMALLKPTPKLNISLSGAINRISYRLNDLFPTNGEQSGNRIFPIIFSPRVGVNYAPNDLMAFYASIGHGFSLPSPEETLLPEGDVNPEIKPEQGFQYEIGSRFSLAGKTLEIDATLYWIELDNLLVTKRITEDIFTGINAGKTRHQGFEILLKSLIFEYGGFPGKLFSTASFSQSINRFIDFTDDGNNYNGNLLPGIPGQSLQLQVKWNPFEKLEVLTHLLYSGDQYLNDSNSLKYQDYWSGNIKVTARVKFRKAGLVFLYAGINNLTNTHYASMLIVNALGFNNNEPRYYYPGLPRHGYAGIQYRF